MGKTPTDVFHRQLLSSRKNGLAKTTPEPTQPACEVSSDRGDHRVAYGSVSRNPMSQNFLFLLSIFGIALLGISCSAGQISRSASKSTVRPGSEHTSSSPIPNVDSRIRSVDFDDIEYPNFPDYNADEDRTITLGPGEGGPNFINYGDVTGDGVEDAMVVLGISVRGSAIPHYVYIFTMEERPKLIWDFETGDRADGGLRQVYADKGQLVIELFGKDRVIGGELHEEHEPLCCPSSFTRARYKWTGTHFELISNETLLKERENANVIMPMYIPVEKPEPSP